MNKQEFIANLRTNLCGLPNKEVDERIDFYVEMIDDRMEEGLSEEEAVFGIGSVDEISAQIIADIPFTRIAAEGVKPKRRLKAWEIVLLVLGAPIWLSLGLAAVAVVLSLYVSVWSVIVSLWAVFASLIGGVVTGVVFVAVGGNGLSGIAIIGASVVCVGLSIFLFFGCKAATDGIILLTRKIALGIKKCFIKKENV